MTWTVFALTNGLIIAAYFVGKDAGIDQERRRNARRRSHQHNTRKEHN
jgi:hypothetical protein